MTFCLSSKYIDKQIMIVKKPNNLPLFVERQNFIKIRKHELTIINFLLTIIFLPLFVYHQKVSTRDGKRKNYGSALIEK